MIQAHNLSKTFQKTLAVDQIDLNVGNELFVFLGPNGAGKTTSIKMLAGLVKPTNGSIYINGIDMIKNPLKAKRVIGYVSEQPYLYDKLRGHEFLQFIADIHNIPFDDAQKRMNQLLDIFEIQDRVDDIIEDFSHGMKRKIALIAALIHNPDVLFLDEPTIGLDPRSAHHLKNLLRELVRKGKTIFMTTHILELAEKMCDRIGIIHKGRLIMVNTAENIQKDIESSKKSLEDVFLDLTQTDQTSSIKEYLKTV